MGEFKKKHNLSMCFKWTILPIHIYHSSSYNLIYSHFLLFCFYLLHFKKYYLHWLFFSSKLKVKIVRLFLFFFFFFLVYFIFIEHQLIFNVVLASGVQQADSCIYIYSLLQDIEYNSRCFIVGPGCLSILYVVVCIC